MNRDSTNQSRAQLLKAHASLLRAQKDIAAKIEGVEIALGIRPHPNSTEGRIASGAILRAAEAMQFFDRIMPDEPFTADDLRKPIEAIRDAGGPDAWRAEYYLEKWNRVEVWLSKNAHPKRANLNKITKKGRVYYERAY